MTHANRIRLEIQNSELASLKLRSVMTPSPITIDEDTSVTAARAFFHEKKVRHLPVTLEGKLTGILSDRDTRLVALMPQINKIAVADLMTRNPLTVSEDTPVLEAVSKMAAAKYGCLIATSATGEVSGIFTSQDALRLLIGDCAFNPSAIPKGLVTDSEDDCPWD